MTKLIRKLKQMSKKKAHRKAVQKRKLERVEKEHLESKENKDRELECLVDEEMAKLEEGTSKSTGKTVQQAVRVVGDLVLDVRSKKTKQLTRKQAKRKERMITKGEGVKAALAKKLDVKKRCVKARAQVRNSELQK